MELTYHETAEGYLMPNLAPPSETTPDIGTWGRRRKRYLKDNRKGTYTVMKTEGTLFDHLAEVNRQAEAMWTRLVEQMAAAQGVDGQMKRQDQMAWVGRMNAIRNQAEEAVNLELVYS
jgi:hypothetical protein